MTWGESHGPAIGVVIDGCPPGLPLDISIIQSALDRRRPGQSSLTSPRQEADKVRILSGIHQNHTLGTPISLLIENRDARPQDYSAASQAYRPGHADFTYAHKYGQELPSGGGRASARETAARVAAGAIAAHCLKLSLGIEILAYVSSLHTITVPPSLPLSRELIEATPVRCPHLESAQAMMACIEAAKQAGDSVGGIITGYATGLPIGLGDPIFDRLEADLAKAMLSIPATKGFDIGQGFESSRMFGSEHNDAFVIGENQSLQPATNHAGGVLGGISTGAPLTFRVAFKPPSTIQKGSRPITATGQDTSPMGGRHDPCVLPRAVPIVEAMTALVLLDHVMCHKAHYQNWSF